MSRRIFGFRWLPLVLSLLSVNGETFLPIEKAKLKVIRIPPGFAPRIVGGNYATLGQFPFQVALHYGNGFCGGSLIRSNWVLTAAHCVYDSNHRVISPDKMTIRAGTVFKDQGGFTRKVQQVIVNEKYKSRDKYNYDFDLALLKLTESFQLDKYIKTISLVRSRKDLKATDVVTISGWGKVSETGSTSKILKYNRAKPLSSFTCFFKTRTIRILCLESPTNNGVCGGDSGGPAVSSNRLVGVANFGYGCGTTKPDGYAKVSDHIKWIDATINRY
uniref:Serine protease SP24D n=1 Tax=Culex pipiens TaxID=7175 RepID=A0A8D8BD38_CULPI